MDNTEETKMEILEPFLDECLDAEEEDEKVCLVDQNEIQVQPGLLLTTIPKWHPTYMLEAEIKIVTKGSKTAILLTNLANSDYSVGSIERYPEIRTFGNERKISVDSPGYSQTNRK